MKPDEAAFEEYVSTWPVEQGGYAEVKGPRQARPSAIEPVLPVASSQSRSPREARP